MAREYEMLFKLNAQVAGSYNSAFRAAQTEIRTYQKEIQALNTTAANISGFQKQTTAVAEAQKKIELLQQQYDNIQREIQETGTYSSDLENKLISKKNQIDKAGEALQIATDRLETYRKALEDSGVDTDNLEQETRDLQEEIKELRKKQEEAAEGFDDMGEEGTSAAETLKEALVSAGITKILKEITDFLGDCTDAAMGFEHSMAGVRRTVGGTDEFLTELGDSFQDIATTIPLTTTELGTIAETAGQLGIAQERVEQFTIVMAQLGTTTDLTASDAATMLAQYSNITGVTDYERLGSVVASLGDATATTASKVVDMSLGMAASASIAGFSERDILAVAAAVGSLGIESAAGSTAMSQLISMLYKATETGEKLTEIADIAGMSASEFKTAWGEDAVGAMNTFVQGLTDVERNGKSAIVLLDELGITNVRQVKAILSLAQAGDLLAGTINQANKAWDENTALGQKADIMYSSTQSKLTMMQNSYSNLQIELGENFTPVLQTIYTMANGLFSGLASFVDRAPGVTKAIVAITLGATAFAAAITAIVVVTKAWKVAQTALNAAIAANPYLLAIGAVIGLTVAIGTFVASIVTAEEEVEKLTASSEEQRQEIESLRAEYEAVCEAQGETSAEAQLLKARLDDQSESFERNKQTAEDFAEEIKAANDAYQEQVQRHEDQIDAIETEYDGTFALIDRLNELTEAEYKNAAAKEEILAIVDILNERIPELGLNYDELTGKLNMTPEEVIKIAESERTKETRTAKWNSLIEKLGSRETLSAEAEKIKAEYEAAQKAEAEAKTKNDQLWAYVKAAQEGNYYTNEMGQRASNAEQAYEEAMAYTKQMEEAYATAEGNYTHNEAEIKALSEELGTVREETELATYGMEEMGEASDRLVESLEELKTAYTEAYEAAYESISGQYALWDEVADVSATSVKKTTKNIEEQAKYWADYNSNIETLLGYAPGINGLSDMVASFADGSEESVNMIAGMVASIKDGDTTALQNMVNAWSDLKTQQQETAQNLAELETGIGEETLKIIDHFTNEVEQLDLSAEAKKSGMSTIEGYIEGAESLLPDVSTAFGKISNAVRSALFGSATAGGGSPVVTEAYASGTTNAKRGWNWVGEEGPELMWMGGGEVILPADISARVTSSSTIEALSNTSTGGGTVLHYSPTYQISGSDPERVEEVLREHDSSLRSVLMDMLEDIRSDEERRVYN